MRNSKGQFIKGYNECKGRKLSKETKRKISEANKGRTSPMKGKKHTNEAKKKIGEMTLRMWQTKNMTERNKKVSNTLKKIGAGKWNIGRKASKETKEKIKQANSGKNGYQWKGENAGYDAIHKWVRKHKGSPKTCSKCGVKGKYIDCKYKNEIRKKWSIQWANKDHKYRRKLKDYIALCHKCHNQYDIDNKLYGNIWFRQKNNGRRTKYLAERSNFARTHWRIKADDKRNKNTANASRVG